MSITIAPVYGSFSYESNYADVEEWDDDLGARVVVSEAARSDIARSAPGYLSPRTVTVRGTIGHHSGITTQDLLRTYADAFRYAHRPNALRSLYRDNDRYLRNVAARHLTIPKDTGLLWLPYSVELVAADPHFYAVTPDSDTWATPSTGDTHAIANGGTATALPKYSFTFSGAGNLLLNLYSNTIRPAAPTLTGSGTGGLLAAATYWVVLTWVFREGETVAGIAASDARTGTTSKITVAAPTAPADAIGYNVYAGTGVGEPANSAKYLQNTYGPIPIGTDFVLRSLLASGDAASTPTWGSFQLGDGTASTPVAVNDVLTVDTLEQVVTLNGALKMSYFVGSFFPLLPGSNTLKVTFSGGTVSAVGTDFQKRYL